MFAVSHQSSLYIDPQHTPRGAFQWWYVDLREADGTGIVVIWSLGLPFLPGSREGDGALRPSISIAHYVQGRQALYLLQDHSDSAWELDRTTGSGYIHQSKFEVSSTADRFRLRAELDEPMPRTDQSLRGEIVVEGPPIQLSGPGGAVSHAWSPLSFRCEGHAKLDYAGRSHRVSGSAYCDSNASSLPLHDQGISSWRWGRATFPDYTIVYYELEDMDGDRQRFVLEQTRDGQFRQPTGRVDFYDSKRGVYGLDSPRLVQISTQDRSVTIEQQSLVEDGPFYSRQLTVARDEDGNVGTGFSEVVRPTHIDQKWQRPLVRMRTHRVGGNNSAFLPLFNGPRVNRGERLARALLAGISP